jgi:branched-subunit amino acid ABC-type transport system permease component
LQINGYEKVCAKFLFIKMKVYNFKNKMLNMSIVLVVSAGGVGACPGAISGGIGAGCLNSIDESIQQWLR